MSTTKLINAEADLAAKFVGEFTCDGGNGQSILQLYRTGKIVTTNRLSLPGENVEFITSGSWYMEGKEIVMTILDEKEANVIYRVKPSGGANLGLILGLSIGIPVLVAGIAVGVFFIIKKKKKEKQ